MYIKKGESFSQIKEGLKQVFNHNFTINVGQREIIKMKNAEVITERDLKISRFLFNFKFATAEQICRYLKFISNEETYSVENVERRLNKLVQYRVLNKFMLTQDLSLDKIQPDALDFYCLDLGGRYLLANYSNEDSSDWYSIVNMKGSEKIVKDLCVTEFYLSLLETVLTKISYFKPGPDIRIGKNNIGPSFDMCIDNLGSKNYFVGEVVREFDFPVYFRDRAYKLENLFMGNGWKKYYYDASQPPVLFLLADNDETALEVSKLMTETTEINRFRITTDERMKKPLYELGAFLKYDDKEKELKEIKSVTFLP